MSLFQLVSVGALIVVYGLLLGVTVWAVHTRGKIAGSAKAWRDMAMRVPRDQALTVVAPEYHSPHGGVRFAKGGPWGGLS